MEAGRFSLRLNARGNLANYRMRVDNPNAAPCDIQTFGPGDSTWVMPDGARLVQVSLIAAGGGGTAGWRGTPTSALASSVGVGGAGGEGGGWAVMTFPASTLPNTVPLIVGSGGVGDMGATADGEFGAGATDGGGSSFDGYLTVVGGRCTRPDAAVLPVIRSMLTPGTSGAPDAAGCPGGGFGGALAIHADGDPVTVEDARQGGRSTLTGAAAAVAGVASGDGGDGATQSAGQPMAGNGGGGGAASLTAPAGAGGNGGDYGAGGGGGGASGDGFPSGDGGTGGDGICTVVTYF